MLFSGFYPNLFPIVTLPLGACFKTRNHLQLSIPYYIFPSFGLWGSALRTQTTTPVTTDPYVSTLPVIHSFRDNLLFSHLLFPFLSLHFNTNDTVSYIFEFFFNFTTLLENIFLAFQFVCHHSFVKLYLNLKLHCTYKRLCPP